MDKKLKIHHLSFIIRKSQGFTLIELLIAISIIGVLSSFLLANFVGVRQRARDGVRKSDLRQIQSALELFRSDQSTYPSSPLPGCGSALTTGGTTYMQKIPCDPSSGAVYAYSVGAGNTTYSLIACLENGNDSQIDRDVSNNKINCASSTTLWQYTLQNP